jgi:peroxiredoxin
MIKEKHICDFDWVAPDFELPSTGMKLCTRDSLRKSNGLLVMFICNHCPYVLSALDRIIKVSRDLANKGVGVVAISSNDVETYPLDSFENMKKLATTNSFPFPYLFDETQSVARAYGAECTPDFFGFNNTLGLQYRGRLDSGGKGTPSSDQRNDLYEGMLEVATTGLGPRDQIASMGCSIKWKNQ